MLTWFLLILHLVFAAAEEIPVPPHKGGYSVGAGAHYYFSDSNFGHDGTTDKFGGDYSEWGVRPRAAYDLSSALRLYGSLTYLSVDSTGTPGSSSDAGLADLAAGGQFWIRSEDFKFVPQFEAVFPTYRADTDSRDALIGEGAMTLSGGSWLLYDPFRETTFYGFLAFKYRDEGRSFLMPYDFGINYRFSPNGLWLQGGIRGYQTVYEDTDSANDAERDLFLNRSMGGTWRYYQINPSVSEFAADLGSKFARGAMGYSFGAAYAFRGESAAQGMTFEVTLTYYGGRGEGFSAHESMSDDPIAPLPVHKEPAVQKFKEPEPKYDEGLFKDEVEVGKPPVEKVIKQQKAAQKKASSPNPTTVKLIPKKPKKVNVDKAIQDAERALEKRK